MKDTSKNTIGRTRNVARKRLAVYFLSQIFRSLAAFDLMIVPLLRLHGTFYRRMDYTMVKKEKTASRKFPGVSFIVTSFNKEGELEYTLRSLMGQEGDFEREYIVVDDQSTDRSFEIAMDIVGQLSNGKVLRQRNSGPANAQDHGVRHATLPFLCFVDGDTVLAPDCILRLMAAFDHPGIVLSISDTAIEIENLGNLPAIPRQAPPVFRHMFNSLEEFISRSICFSSGTLVRRDAYLACGGCDRHIFNHENSFPYRMALHHGIAITDEPLVAIEPHQVRSTSGNNLGQVSIQMEHDRNAALYGLVRDHPDLSLSIRRLALRRAAGRAWKWDRRRNEAVFGLARSFWLNLLSYMPWLPDYEGLLRLTTHPYLRTGGVRVPTPLPESDLSALKNGTSGEI